MSNESPWGSLGQGSTYEYNLDGDRVRGEVVPEDVEVIRAGMLERLQICGEEGFAD